MEDVIIYIRDNEKTCFEHVCKLKRIIYRCEGHSNKYGYVFLIPFILPHKLFELGMSIGDYYYHISRS